MLYAQCALRSRTQSLTSETLPLTNTPKSSKEKPITETNIIDVEAEDIRVSKGESSKRPNKSVKTKCPCNTSSNGKSWIMNCTSCGQVWHNGCANIKDKKLTKEAIESILPDWQCPWCYISPYPRPKNHKAMKTEKKFQGINQANEITAVIESLETMVDTKLTEILKANTFSVEAIGKRLGDLSKEIADFKNSPCPQATIPPIPPHVPGPCPQQPKPVINIEDTPLTHKTKHIEELVDDFLTAEEEKYIIETLEQASFVSEGNRGVLQFGEHYKYMGSRTKPKDCPESLKKLMDKINQEFSKSHQDRRYHYDINSCLVNRYESNMSVLPEHSDNEGDINPLSSIFTLSLGATRTVLFRDLQSNEEKPVSCKGKSMYRMTRHSQDFYKHQIKAEPDQANGPRYSLTFRSIHWSNFNSTMLIGDSNFGKIQFGTGKGKVGQATPGFRSFNPKTSDIDPLACTSYRNVVVMTGTNDLKKNNLSDTEILDLYKVYKTKITQIKKHNPNCKIFVCPVLSTKSREINKQVFSFNKYIHNDLIQSSLGINFVEGFIEFVDRQTSLIRRDFAVSDSNDILHINDTKGVRLYLNL